MLGRGAQALGDMREERKDVEARGIDSVEPARCFDEGKASPIEIEDEELRRGRAYGLGQRFDGSRLDISSVARGALSDASQGHEIGGGDEHVSLF